MMAATVPETSVYVPPSPPQLNGGLYVGAPFAPQAPWGNVQVTPDAGAMNLITLSSAGPPPMGRYHLPGGGLRPGNNTPLLPTSWTQNRFTDIGLVCIPDALADADRSPYLQAPPGAPSEQMDFRAYAYLPTQRAWRPCAAAASRR
jgi:hypothetical protein